MLRALPGPIRPGHPRRVQVICWHGCEGEQLSEVLRAIDLLRRDHEIVPYSQAVERVRAGATRPTIALTFDDGTSDHLPMARALAERSHPACFFVCPALMDGAHDPQRSAAACAALRRDRIPGVLGWDEVRQIAALGHEIGCHSMTHPDMGTLTGALLDEQISAARARLAAADIDARHFAWPFGRFARFGADAARRVFAAGFESCASAERGWHVGGTGTWRRPCIRREVAGEQESGVSLASRLAFRAAGPPARAGGWPDAWTPLIARD